MKLQLDRRRFLQATAGSAAAGVTGLDPLGILADDEGVLRLKLVDVAGEKFGEMAVRWRVADGSILLDAPTWTVDRICDLYGVQEVETGEIRPFGVGASRLLPGDTFQIEIEITDA